MNYKYPNIFSEYHISGVKLKNRLCMAPMTSNYGTKDGYVTEKMINYYSARAKGGVGLIFVEACYVNGNGKGFVQQLALDDDKYIPGLRQLVENIHSTGANAFLQLIHGGRQCSSVFSGTQPVAPSPIPCPVLQEMPRELTVDEIKGLVEDFGAAAERAYKAGFDGVDVHCAHGYLVNQFLSPYSNRRSDRYGGDLKGRARFLAEIVENIRKRLGPLFPISVRLSAEEYVPGGLALDESILVCEMLVESGVDAVSVSGGVYQSVERLFPPMDVPQGSLVYLAEAIKKVVSIPVLTVGGLVEPAFVEQILQEGKADGVLLGRALLADPEWPRKALEGREHEIIPCIGCNQCRNRTVRQEINCTVNYRTGREKETELVPAAKEKLVMVAGGGLAGMQAAAIAKERGFRVVLYEASDKLGGQLNLATIPPRRERLANLINYLGGRLNELGVKVITGTKANEQVIAEVAPDVVICATGAKPLRLPIPGLNKPNVYSFAYALEHPEKLGRYVLVVGGGLVGCEVADFLLERGHAVTIIEIRAALLMDSGVEGIVKSFLLKRINQPSRFVLVLTDTKVLEIRNREVVVEKNNVPKILPNIDSVVIAAGSFPDNDLFQNINDGQFEKHLT